MLSPPVSMWKIGTGGSSLYCTSNHNTFKVSLVFSLTGKCVKETFGNNGLFDSKEANQDAKMDRIFQMLHKFKIRVLPPQPD